MRHRRLLRWAALPVTDRRWAAPLSAVALGFGLFAGVAIGPGAAGTLATGVPQVIEIPAFGEATGGEATEGEEAVGSEAGEEAPSAPAPSPAGAGEASLAPPLGGEEGAPAPLPGESAPASEPPAEEEAESPQAPEEQELTGTVVHVNPAAGSYTVVEAGGTMSAVHAGRLPQAGTLISVPIETLANGTLGEAGRRVRSGTRARATLAGIVTWVDPDPAAPAYTVSNRGTSALIHVRPEASGAVPPLPPLGAYASVAVDIEAPQAAAAPEAAAPAPPPAEPACAPDPGRPLPTFEPKAVLWQRHASSGGAPYTHGDFAGILTAICPQSGQLLISADDLREGGHDLLFAVPPGIDTSKLEVGQSLLAGAGIGAEGTLTLTGLASDEHLKGADDAKATQGDLVPEKEEGEG